MHELPSFDRWKSLSQVAHKLLEVLALKKHELQLDIAAPHGLLHVGSLIATETVAGVGPGHGEQ